MALRKLKVVCGEYGWSLQVLDAETGEDLRLPIRSARWSIDGQNRAVMTLDLFADIVLAPNRITIHVESEFNPPNADDA